MMPQPQQTEQDQRTAEACTAFTASLSSVESSLNVNLWSHTAILHVNSAAFVKQEADLVKKTAVLAKQTAQWQKMADNSQKKLKKIEDVQNWAEMIERNLLVIKETLTMVEDVDTNHMKHEDRHARSEANGWY